MRRRLLRYIARNAFRFGASVFLIIILLTLMSISGINRLRLESGLAEFLPPDSAHARAIGEMVQDYRNLEPVLVSFDVPAEGSEEDLIQIVKAFAEVVEDSEYFSRAVFRLDDLAQQYYESLSGLRLIALLTPDDWRHLTDLMESRISSRRFDMSRARRICAFLPRIAESRSDDPLGVLASIRTRLSPARAPIPVMPRNGYLFSRDGRTLQMLLYAARSSDDVVHAVRSLDFLEASREFVLGRTPQGRSPAEITFAGSHVETARSARVLVREIGLISLGALGLLCLLLILMFRKAEALAFVLVPPVLGSVWALGLAHAFCSLTGFNQIFELDQAYTRVTGVTAAFLVITFGMGLSWSLHLFHSFTIELYRTRNFYRALQAGYVDTGRGIVTSSLTATLLFGSLYFTSFRGLQELGILSGAATLCNLAACLLVIPTLAALKSRMSGGRISPLQLRGMRFSRLSGPALRMPRATVGAVLLVSVFLGIEAAPGRIQVMNLRFHERFTSITSYLFRPEAKTEAGDNRTDPPGRPLVAIVEAETIQEALERNDSIYEDLVRIQRDSGEELGIQAIDSLRVILPSMATQRRSLERLRGFDLESLDRSVLEASNRAGYHPAIFQNFSDSMATLQSLASQIELLEYSTAAGPDFTRAIQRFVTHKDGKYRIATPIFPGPLGFDQFSLDHLLAQLDPTSTRAIFIGDAVIERELSSRLKYDFAFLLLLAGLSVFVALVIHFRGLRPASIAFAAVAVQGLWVGGAMRLADIPVHFLTLMTMPLGVVLALDNAIHMLQFARDRRVSSSRLAMISLGRPVVLSCCSIALLYGMLALSVFEGLRDMGRVVLFGSAASLVITLSLLPALIQIWGRDQPLRSILRPTDPEAIDLMRG